MKKILSIVTLLYLGTAMLVQAQQHKTYSTYNNQPELSASGSVTLLSGFHAPSGSNLKVFISDNCGSLSSNRSGDRNYILTRTFKVAGINEQSLNNTRTLCEENQAIQYFDGLGRSLQTVLVGASPTYQDIVTPVAYDALGRETIKYQPYAATGANGSYRTTAITDQLAFYTGQSTTSSIKQTNSPFSVAILEPSPINRVERQGFPGDAWQPNNVSTEHTARLAYGTNNSDVNYGTTGFAVRLFSANAVTTVNHEHERSLTSSGYYEAGQLYLTISRDENWQANDGKKGTVEEYKDKEGRIVLKRMFNEKGGNIEVLSTYYVYDDLGNLSFVLPPGTNPDAGVPNDTVIGQFCYQYRYDERSRLIEKKISGKGWEHMVYNKLDQIVLSRDSNLVVKGQWLFTKYDVHGRTILTGIYDNSASRSSLQSIIGTDTVLWEYRDNMNANLENTGYTNHAFPNTSIFNYHVVNYYDDYDFYNNIFGQPDGNKQVTSSRTKELPTGIRTAVLDTAAWLLSVSYYDSYGRPIQVKNQHHLGGIDVVDTEYEFDGSVRKSIRSHTNGVNTTVIANRYKYDHIGRKIKTYQTTYGESQTGGVEVMLSELQYNELGQLEIKKLHNGIQVTSHRYNERGWLNSLNSVEFNMSLTYGEDYVSVSDRQYNGNISGQNFTNGNSNTFIYQYDKLNRLTSGVATSMSEVVDYDLMGNITRMNRDNTGPRVYNYIGNQLQNVTGFTGLYIYDGNGNATKDGRNGMGLIYNHMNLPISATRAASGGSSAVNLVYTYDALGRKLRKASTIGATSVTDYVAGIQYSNGKIDFIQTEEGIAFNSDGIYTYRYNLGDHLDNVRVTFKESNGAIDVLQRDNYYAYGLRKSVSNGVGLVSRQNKYLYNGKELQEELEQYDYGARFYDPEIARWLAIDPLAEIGRRWSPYHYAFDNPLRYIDPDGMWSIDKNGNAFTNNPDEIEDFINNVPGREASQEKNDNEKKEENGSSGIRVKVSEPRDETTYFEAIKNRLNPMIDTSFEVETDWGKITWQIDSDGYITITGNEVSVNEANVGGVFRMLRTFSKLRTAVNMAKVVRNARLFKNASLRNYLSHYYRLQASVGNGSSAAALMEEAKTGILLSAKGHLQKVAAGRTFFASLLNSGASLSSFEKQFVVRQIVEATRAINVATRTGSRYSGTITKEILKIIRNFK